MLPPGIRSRIPSAAEAPALEGFASDGTMVVPRPYDHTFESYVKGRWLGSTLVDMFAKEFPYDSREFYDAQRERGRLCVKRQCDREPLPPAEALTHKLRTGDLVTHTVRRQELPVVNAGPLVVTTFVPASDLGLLSGRTTEGLILIAKPPTLPVHPCGRYHKATVTELLAAGYFIASEAVQSVYTDSWFADLKRHLKHEPAHTVHRLDKATSGVLMVATSKSVSAAVFAMLNEKSEEPDRKQFTTAAEVQHPQAGSSSHTAKDSLLETGKRGRPTGDLSEGNPDTCDVNATDDPARSEASPCRSEKVYLARVHGKFPGGGSPVTVDRAIYCASHREGRFAAVTEHEEETRRRRAVSLRRGLGQPGGESTGTAAVGRADAQVHLLEAKSKGDKAAVQQALEEKRSAQRRRTDEGATGGRDSDGPENAKWALTVFRCVRYVGEDDTSIVECRPVTGRTHQLRVHLALLGHPIVLDAQYGPAVEGDVEGAVRRLFNLPAGRGPTGDAAEVPDQPSKDNVLGDASPPSAYCDAEAMAEFWRSYICLHAKCYDVHLNSQNRVRLEANDPPWAAEGR